MNNTTTIPRFCVWSCGGICVPFTLWAAFASTHKVLWHSDINHVTWMTGGWSSISLIRLCGDAPCPHPQLLQQHLFTSSGLSVWRAVLSLLMSQTHVWRTHTTYTQKNLACIQGWVGFFQHALSAPNTDHWHSYLTAAQDMNMLPFGGFLLFCLSETTKVRGAFTETALFSC